MNTKNFALVLVSGILVAGRVMACTDGCSINMKVYDKVFGKYCTNNSTYVSDTGAQEIAVLAAKDQLDDHVFLESFYKTCDFDSAKEVALAAKDGSMDFGAYKKSLFSYCTNNSTYVSDDGARKIARLVAQGKLSGERFLKDFYKTCDYESAKRVGLEAKDGNLDHEAYEHVLFQYCSNNSTYVSDDGARQIAEAAAQNHLDTGAFLDVFKKTCNFDSAKAVASCNIVGANLNLVLKGGQSSFEPGVSGSMGSKASDVLTGGSTLSDKSVERAI